MSDHASFQALAKRLLEKNGRVAVLSFRATTEGAKPWQIAQASPVNLNVKMLFFPTVMRDDKGTVIPGNFQRAYLAYTSIEEAWADWHETNAPSVDPVPPVPKLTSKDVVIDGGREYRVVRPGEVKPGDQSILYDILIAG